MSRTAKTSVRLNENISIYPRVFPSGKIWYARFRISKPELSEGKKYLTETLRTLDKEEAEYRAKERYLEIQFKQKTGQTIQGKYVRDAINDFMDDYKIRMDVKPGFTRRKGSFTPTMYRYYRKTVVRYWMEYCGDFELSMVKYETFDEYELWRRTYYRRMRNAGKTIHPNSRENPSERTIQMEINAMKVVMRWARNNRYYNGNEIDFRYTATKQKRHAFTLGQYRKLVRYMRSPNFYAKGKHGNDALIRRSREQIRAFILFIANTGLRPGTETRNLKWGDIEFVNESGQKYIRVAVPSSGKSRKSRQAIGRYTARRALERLRENRTDNTGDDDYIFCNREGNTIQHFREIFDAVIEEADVKFYQDGNYRIKHTPYSLRHTYITFRLRHTENPNLLALALNCGTSVAMIENYYNDAIPRHFLQKLL